jgi:hypothetical protein
LLLAALGAVAATAPAHRQDSDKGCNVHLKGLKTLSDPQRKLVNLHAKNTTAGAINALPQSHPTPKTRTTGFSRRVWRVTAQITEFKIEGDSDPPRPLRRRRLPESGDASGAMSSEEDSRSQGNHRRTQEVRGKLR